MKRSIETIERDALLHLRAQALRDLEQLLYYEPPHYVLPGQDWRAYRGAIRECLDDLERARGLNADGRSPFPNAAGRREVPPRSRRAQAVWPAQRSSHTRRSAQKFYQTQESTRQ
jgi:hypothetical protein